MSIPKRVSEMTADERLESLKAWCEEQKYVRPGESGTLGVGPRGISQGRQMSYSGPVKFVHHQYTAPIAPPSYETVMAETAKKDKKNKKGGVVKKWLDRKKRKGDEDVARGAGIDGS